MVHKSPASAISGFSRPALNVLISAILALLLTLTANSRSHAQINLQIGGSESQFKARLSRDGYDRIHTRKIGLSSSIFEACKDGRRYEIRFEWTGNVSRKIIGDCRRIIQQADIRKMLRERGYRRITIEDRAGKYLAIGCVNGQRYRAEINYYGDIRRERRIGQCLDQLSPTDITAKLEAEGFDRIRFTDRQPPEYVAQACNNGERLELVLDGLGEIKNTRRLGSCRSSIGPDQIVDLMKEKGYTRVEVISARPPRFVAEGCRDNRRFEVTLNRWGEVANEVFLRNCRTAFTKEQIIASMRENGYKNVSIVRDGRNFIAKGCRDNRYNEIILSRYGELVSRRDLGSCEAPRINDLAETLRRRGLSDLQFYVEACRNGSRVRISFDEFANRTGRETIGGC